MHSSRMRIGRLLTICRSLLPEGGVLSPRGVYLDPGGWGGVLSLGVYLVLVYLVPGGSYLVLGGVLSPEGWGGVLSLCT